MLRTVPRAGYISLRLNGRMCKSIKKARPDTFRIRARFFEFSAGFFHFPLLQGGRLPGHLFHVFLGAHPHRGGNRLSVLYNRQGRNAHHAELLGEGRLLIHLSLIHI